MFQPETQLGQRAGPQPCAPPSRPDGSAVLELDASCAYQVVLPGAHRADHYLGLFLRDSAAAEGTDPSVFLG